ncbi:response regulator [Ramlibacter rhizophilus]|uniref:Response regulator n=1 Tax=Ramlibacter rhizophilus TaxID=1781167 RepID=A0A4Z0BQ29_9BURK|nr:response regulator [Ramlibacter rhizophilus]TFZ01403.1 response regulator [Ramlibacter rhizophilus]
MSLRAFIVEDSLTIRDNLIETLEELASVQAVGIAETERDGAEWLCGHSAEWDLAIVDLYLREGNGLNIVSACRERRDGQKLVVLSNHASRDIRQRCAQLGADAVFDKSTEIDALVDYCVRQAAR